MRGEVGDGVVVAAHEVVGAAAGPILSVLAGVHGDEFEGQIAARRLLAEVQPAQLRGTLRVVVAANPPAVAAATRTSPIDGKNLARVFPGDPDGSVTERIARWLTDHVISGADLLVDLHSAGRDFAMPLFAGYPRESGAPAAEAARRFGAPFVWEHHPLNPGRSLTAAVDLGVPCIYVEGNGGGGLRGADVAAYRDGLRRILVWLDMCPPGDVAPATPPRRLVGGDGDVDASVSAKSDGWCVTTAEPGDVLGAGDLIAEIVGADGAVAERITAPNDGTLMFIRRRADVSAGDLVAMLGPVPEPA